MMLTEEKLNKLKKETAHLSTFDGLPSNRAEQFAEPMLEGKCLYCGETGTFTWGLTHGEGHCYKCGWPARLYHFVKDAAGGEECIVRLLQYHPDGISLRKKEATL